MNSAAQAAYRRAQAAIDLRRWDTAVEQARQAIAADPAAADCHVMFAHALYCRDDYTAALEAIKGALVLAPTEPTAHRVRGQILLALGQLPAALEATDEVLASSVEARDLGLRARILHRMERRDEARQACRQAIALAPDQVWLYQTLGDIELREVNPRAAEQAYREALRCEPGNAPLLNNLGVALQRQGRDTEAALAFKAAVLADPTMTLAKANAHAAVQKLTGAAAAGAGVAGLGALKYCAVGGTTSLTRAASSGDGTGWTVLALIAAIIVVVIVVYFASVPIRKQRAEARVRKLDPQLWELYQKLDRDKRAGRL